ncbi:oligopeptide/dipeptide ABC transporter ATP-binding protein [Micromonospora sp. WMMB482]|uniref:oligopeptide/dipeptide ABC transporter ATP-binding protein n=1 Tax=Micromonospora sp. WMMB482 TaxID=2849653 RepID=UPI0027E1E469|nr:oligopeptide/dipeptide ABC transporter ATP-binding protein [Micromonospora sp. WMMB482]
MPSPADFPKGCRFSDRCPMATGICRDTAPALEGTDGHGYACHHPPSPSARRSRPDERTAEHRPIAELSDVHVVHASRGGGMFSREKVYALTGADLVIRSGETVGIVGESGCGKSTLAKVLVGLQRPTAGTVSFAGKDVWSMSAAERREHIGAGVGMIFQDPATSLNRRMPVRDILRDPLDVHRRGTRQQREQRVAELMALVGLPRSVADVLPSQLSGGQRQRVSIARALALETGLVIADEPTSALDVSVRAQILNLLLDLKDRLGLAMVLVSHDIQTVKRVSDRVVTMYLGRVVEQTPAGLLPEGGRHPYTRALFSATPGLLSPIEPIPLVGPSVGHSPAERLPVPDPLLGRHRRLRRGHAGAAPRRGRGPRVPLPPPGARRDREHRTGRARHPGDRPHRI